MKHALGAHSWAALPLPPQECGGSLASGDFAISLILEAALTTRCQPPSIISAYPSATSALLCVAFDTDLKGIKKVPSHFPEFSANSSTIQCLAQKV